MSKALRAPVPVEESFVSASRDPEKAHWVVVGSNDDGRIPVWTGKANSSRLSGDQLSKGAIVEELEISACRLHFRLIEGYGPNTGWVNTYMDGADLLVREDRHIAYMKNRVTFSGGRWTPTPLPWVPWQPRDVTMFAEFRWTQAGIDALRPMGLNPGDVFTEKHLQAVHSPTRQLGCSDLEEMGFIEVPQEVDSEEYIWTAKGFSAVLSSRVGTLDYEKLMQDWGNPSVGSDFTLAHLWRVRKQAGDTSQITFAGLAEAGYIELKFPPDAAPGDAAAEDAAAEGAGAEDAAAGDAAA